MRLLDKMLHAHASQADEQVVVLGQVLAADANVGYEDFLNTQVRALNGQRITNLKQLVALVEGCRERFLHFDLDYNQKIILETAKAKAATAEVLRTHCISSDRSADLMAAAAAAGGSSSAGAKKGGGRKAR